MEPIPDRITDKEKAESLSVILSDGEIVVFVVRAAVLLYTLF
jgi:hypothetical protein